MEELFTQFYLPHLKESGCENVVLRVYHHVVRAGSEMVAIQDNPDGKSSLVFLARDKASEAFTDLVTAYPSTEFGIALTSLVGSGVEMAHLFMVDCEIAPQRIAPKDMLQSLRRQVPFFPILEGGFLLLTGNGYHIVSFKRLAKPEWEKAMLLSLCIQCGGEWLADRVGVARSLLRGYASLRVSSYKEKSAPQLVGKI